MQAPDLHKVEGYWLRDPDCPSHRPTSLLKLSGLCLFKILPSIFPCGHRLDITIMWTVSPGSALQLGCSYSGAVKRVPPCAQINMVDMAAILALLKQKMSREGTAWLSSLLQEGWAHFPRQPWSWPRPPCACIAPLATNPPKPIPSNLLQVRCCIYSVPTTQWTTWLAGLVVWPKITNTNNKNTHLVPLPSIFGPLIPIVYC